MSPNRTASPIDSAGCRSAHAQAVRSRRASAASAAARAVPGDARAPRQRCPLRCRGWWWLPRSWLHSSRTRVRDKSGISRDSAREHRRSEGGSRQVWRGFETRLRALLETASSTTAELAPGQPPEPPRCHPRRCAFQPLTPRSREAWSRHPLAGARCSTNRTWTMAPTVVLVTGRFQAFSAEHFGLLALFLLVCVALVVVGRRRRADDTVFRRGFAIVLACVVVPIQVVQLRPWDFDLQSSLPINLCDLAWLCAVYALWTRRPWAVRADLLLGPDPDQPGHPHPVVGPGVPRPAVLRVLGTALPDRVERPSTWSARATRPRGAATGSPFSSPRSGRP